MIYQTLPSAAIKSTAGALLTTRKRHGKDMGETKTEATALRCATDPMVGRFPCIQLMSSNSLFSCLSGIKTPILLGSTGLWNARSDSSLSTNRLRQEEYTNPSLSIHARGPCQNKPLTNQLQAILLPLVSLLPHRPTNRKVLCMGPVPKGFLAAC